MLKMILFLRFGLKYGSLYSDKDRTYGLRPVFTLKSDVKIIGDGTSSNPYVLSV